MAHADHSMTAVTAFGRYWLIALLIAVVSALAANWLVGIPLNAVIDVVMALIIVALGAFEVYFLIRAVGYLVSGRLSEALVWLGAMLVYLLLVFPPILAFDGYAWLTHQHLAGGSQMYDSVTGAISGVFKVPAQLISALLVLVLNAGSAYVNYVAQARTALEIGANLLSILVAAQTLLAARRRHAHDDEH